MLKIHRWIACLLALGANGIAADSGPVRPAESPLAVVRAELEQWVETRQLVSRTRADWEAEKEILTQTKALYARELLGIEEQLGKVSTNSVQVDRERSQAERDLAEANTALDQARDQLATVEAQFRSLLPRFPAPLVETMKSQLARLPEEPATSKLGATERLQTVVALLNEADKFNNAIGIYSETRTNPGGEQVAVDTLYVGLGAAFFVNETGDFAGAGSPGPKGWEWAVQNAIAPNVREAVRIYRGERSATFVPLPVSIR